MLPPSFVRLGPEVPDSPVLLSVPHAGREYPPALRELLAVPADVARGLEDRHVDAVALAARGVEVALVQTRARAWIDLNRAEEERDPLADEGAPDLPQGAAASPKVRAGLGLVPRRAGRAELWRRRWTDAEVRARIAGDHRTYHAELARSLAAARARFGIAVLLDVHSMPPLHGRAPPAVVLGDRRGSSAPGTITRAAERAVLAAGLRVARNDPYAGGHVTERHGRPAVGVHALQIELDRALYLDRALAAPVPAGVAATARVLRAVVDAVAAAAVDLAGGPATLAAE